MIEIKVFFTAKSLNSAPSLLILRLDTHTAAPEVIQLTRAEGSGGG